VHEGAQQGRTDDADERVIRHRLKVYQEETAPVLEYYPADRIAKIEVLRSPAEVFDQILHWLIPLLNRHRAMPADDPPKRSGTDRGICHQAITWRQK
jgi:hypothetical protein